ncbi:MAG: DUF1343 domain-containing protein [Candidatus Lustribacter sp.]|jgi:uncharacterized protein YbbC (DUF1343 family)
MQRSAFLATSAAVVAAPLLAQAAAPHVLPGDDVFISETWRELAGRSIGIVTNQSGVLSDGTTLVDAARANSQIHVKALFAPEHGLRGDRDAGTYVPSYTDPRSGLPVYSLYGATRMPTARMLDGVDVLVFDIQDVGARPYTYASTLAYVMQTAKTYGKEIWVLDRPNPIGGLRVEGPVLDPAYKSFIGLYPIPERHGLTIGELAQLFNGHFDIGAKLRVIALRGWSREMLWADTNLRWTPTSPNVPYALTPLVYLATGLIDEGGVNNGVGTDRPFEYAGGFGFDAPAYARTLTARNIPGARFEPADWVPQRGFWAGKTLAGVQIHVDDPHVFPNVRTAVELLAAARAQKRLRIGKAANFDRDWGTNTVRLGLLDDASPDDIVASWESGLTAYRAIRERYLLY